MVGHFRSGFHPSLVVSEIASACEHSTSYDAVVTVTRMQMDRVEIQKCSSLHYEWWVLANARDTVIPKPAYPCSLYSTSTFRKKEGANGGWYWYSITSPVTFLSAACTTNFRHVIYDTLDDMMNSVCQTCSSLRTHAQHHNIIIDEKAAGRTSHKRF